jgi:hypothetical protein
MKRRHPIAGQAPAGRYRARAGDGKHADLGHAIFPIVTQREDGIFEPIGTGFFVAENGIFLTAAHVVTAVLDNDGNVTGPFGLFQFLPGGQYYVRPIHRATRHLVADVAVGVAVPMHHNTTGAPMPNQLLTLATAPPSLGSPVCTYAYPKTTVVGGKPQTIHFEPAYFDGTLLEHFPQGRDRVVLPGPCFRTSMVIHGGASGGPVIGQNGAVFAINSTGFKDDEVSYVSCVSAALDLAIPEVKLPGDASPRSTTLRELVERGFALSR